jgi:vacuolar-type H+-ATPase subunit I/STV1
MTTTEESAQPKKAKRRNIKQNLKELAQDILILPIATTEKGFDYLQKFKELTNLISNNMKQKQQNPNKVQNYNETRGFHKKALKIIEQIEKQENKK